MPLFPDSATLGAFAVEKPIGSEIQVETLPELNALAGETQGSWNSRTRTITFTSDAGTTYTTAAIAFNATPATIETAVAALAAIGAGNISVGGGGRNFTYSFGGTLADKGMKRMYSTDTGTGVKYYFETIVRGFSQAIQTAVKREITRRSINQAAGGGDFPGFDVPQNYDIGEAGRYTQAGTIMTETFVATGIPSSITVPALSVNTGSLTGGSSVIATTVPGTYSVKEVKQETVTATGGTRTLTFGGQTTTALAYNADAATIQAALVALSNVAAGDITVTGTGPYVYTFSQVYDTRNTRTITFDGQTTTALPFDATPATVQAALSALSNVGADEIVVTQEGEKLVYTYGGTLVGKQPHLRTTTVSVNGYRSSMVMSQEGSEHKVATQN